jgi:hypothetical protein
MEIIQKLMAQIEKRGGVEGKNYLLKPAEFKKIENLEYPVDLGDGRSVSLNSDIHALEVKGRVRSPSKKKKKEVVHEENLQVDALLWISNIRYPTAEEFLREARQDPFTVEIPGAYSKKINKEGTLFFAHDEGIDGKGVILGSLPMKNFTSGDSGRVILSGKFVERGPLDASSLPRKKGVSPVHAEDILKLKETTMPQARADVKIPVEGKEENSKWSDEERKALIDLVKAYESPSQAFRQFAAQTNRTMQAITYQWYTSMPKKGLR